MRRLYGADCPKLFGKWQPTEFHDRAGRVGIECEYFFPFGNVSAESRIIADDAPRHFIKGMGMGCGHGYNPDVLFEPQVLAIYMDAKEAMKRVLAGNPIFAGVDVDRHSAFDRVTGIMTEVDRGKIGGKISDSNNIAESNKIAFAINDALEARLRNRFGIGNAKTQQGVMMGFPMGDVRDLRLGNGVRFVTQLPHAEPYNAGTTYYQVVSDETEDKERHGEVIEESKSFLKEFAYRLVEWSSGVANVGLSGDGCDWQINLSEVFPRGLADDRNPIRQFLEMK